MNLSKYNDGDPGLQIIAIKGMSSLPVEKLSVRRDRLRDWNICELARSNSAKTEKLDSSYVYVESGSSGKLEEMEKTILMLMLDWVKLKQGMTQEARSVVLPSSSTSPTRQRRQTGMDDTSIHSRLSAPRVVGPSSLLTIYGGELDTTENTISELPGSY
jgi:hypothetical protein